MCFIKKQNHIDMDSDHDKMNAAYVALKEYRAKGRSPVAVIHGDDALGAEHTRTLLKHHYIYEITDGWYFEGSGVNPTGWYKAYWHFIAQFLDDKFGKDWCLTSDESLLFLAAEGVIPKHLIIRVAFFDPLELCLPFRQKLTAVWGSNEGLSFEREPRYGLRIFPLDQALLSASPGFFRQHPVEARTCLAMVENTGALVKTALEEGMVHGACRVAGGLRSIGNPWYADSIIAALRSAGRRAEEINPFEEDYSVPMEGKAICSRLRLLWREMRPAVLDAGKAITVRPRDWTVEEILRMTDDVYVKDAFHSLNIDGKVVSEELAAKALEADREADPLTLHPDKRLACAALGYAAAFTWIKYDLINSVTGGKESGTLLERLEEWHETLTSPAIDAGLLPQSYYGTWYRKAQCYVERSRHIPVEYGDVQEAVDTLRELMTDEPDAFVRAVLGHFLLVYIHPHMECNGYLARFLMNTQLVSGGYPWTVITEDLEEEYHEVLEKASAELDIIPFAAFVAMQVNRCDWAGDRETTPSVYKAR